MEWIKKNLIVVISGVVALLLLAGAGFFLFTQFNADRAATEKLAQIRQRWETLERKRPHPGTESVNNIQAAQRDAQAAKGFLATVEEKFSVADTQVVTNDFQFKTLLESTVADLRKEARQSGVEIPNGYAFTFRGQMEKIQFAESEIQTLANQLADVAELSRIVYAQRVHRLEGIKRAASGADDRVATDFLKGEIVTNEVAVVAPYEVVVKGFSRELRGILTGFANADGCFRLRSIKVEPTELASEQNAPQAYSYAPAVQRAAPVATGEGARRDRFESTYGGGNRSRFDQTYGGGGGNRFNEAYGGGRQSQFGRGEGAVTTAPQRYAVPRQTARSNTDELKEKPLQVTAYFDVIRPVQTAE